MIESIDFGRHSLINAIGVVTAVETDTEAFDVQLTHTVPERTTGEAIDISTAFRVYLPERVATVLRYVTDSIVSLMTHEVHEGMHYHGRRIFDPHVTVTGKV